MHHGNTVFQCFLGVLKVDLFSVQINFACILAVNTEQALHQGGFTCAVFAHQCMDRTGLNRQVDAVQSLNTGELLGNTLHPKQDRTVIHFQIIRLLVWNALFCHYRSRACPRTEPWTWPQPANG